MEVAIKYEKIELGGIKVAFKPVSVIKGNYDKEEEVFITDYGQFCVSFLEYDFDSVDYFGYPVKLEDLKKKYGTDDEAEVLSMFFNELGNNYYIGFIDDDYEKINLLSMTLDQITQMYIKTISKKEGKGENDLQEPLITFELEEFKKFLEIETIEELHSLINQFLQSFDEIEKNNADSKNIDLEKDEEQSEEKIDVKKDKKLENYKLDKEQSKKMITLKELREEVKSSIIGQDDAVDDITRTLIINNTSKNYRNKSHIFISGPSGTGKTEIANIIAEKFGLPVFKANATEYSKTGYQGKEVNSMLAGLLEAAGGNLEKAQNGILIIDEMDKVPIGLPTEKGFAMAVIYSLLKIMDRDVIEVEIDHYNSVLFDTSNLNIICLGAFDEYLKEKRKYGGKNYGYDVSNSKTEEQNVRITEEDLIKNFGSEFVGRLGLITSTEKLDIENIVKILYESKISQLKIIKEDLLNRGVQLEYDDEYVREIARLGSSESTGVRNLNKRVKENFKYAYDQILLEGNVKKLIFTKETALNPRKYYTN